MSVSRDEAFAAIHFSSGCTTESECFIPTTAWAGHTKHETYGEAFEAGKEYEEVRDTLRKEWNEALLRGW